MAVLQSFVIRSIKGEQQFGMQLNNQWHISYQCGLFDPAPVSHGLLTEYFA